MHDIFSTVIYNSIWGSVLILVILALRLVLRKAPTRILCVMWILAELCLLLPARPQTTVSLQPSSQSVQHTMESVIPAQPVDKEISIQVPAPEPQSYTMYIWGAGVGILSLYALSSYWLLKIKLRKATIYSDGIRTSHRIRGAFVLGYLRPRIYLPQNLNEAEREYIVAHEQAHIRRGDHWWKLLGFVCVCIHWFNPVVWLGYFLMCRDIETACDEHVIRNMPLEQRKVYSFALLNSGKQISGISTCPVAFGEISLKQRIKNVLSYNKPSFAICCAAILLVAVVAVCFLTLPASEPSSQAPTIEQSPVTQTTEPTEDPTKEEIQPTAEDPTEEETQPETQEPTEPPMNTSEPTVPAPQPTTPVTKPSVPPTSSTGSNTKVDTDRVDARITTYAASLGFQTLDFHPNGNVKSFSYTYSIGLYDSGSNDEATIYAKGQELVKLAYAYCEEIGSPIGQSVVWCRIRHDVPSYRYYLCVYCATVEAQ